MNGTTMDHGYEPTRITNLTQQSRWAVSALDGIHSSDPAAAEAMSALAGLKSVIADGLIPAATTVGVVDPLGGIGRPGSASLLGADWYDEWLDQRFSTPYEEMSDDELFVQLDRLEDSLPYDDDFDPDMEDPFWDEFDDLAVELAVRAETDDDFAARLAREAGTSVLIPVALDFARFPPAVVVDMLETVTYSRQTLIDIEYSYQAYGTDLMLEFLTDHPDLALELLANSPTDRGESLIGELLMWPTIDQALLAGFIDAAMTAPFNSSDVDQLEQAGWVLQDLIDLANRQHAFPNGFPPAVSPTLAKILIQYLPFIVTSLDGRGDVHLVGFDFKDFGVELGTYEEMLDLFGAVMRDPLSLDILLAIIPTLATIGIEHDRGIEITLDDVANYLDFLKDAAANEQLEEQLEAARDEDQLRVVSALVFGAIGAITQVTGPIVYKGVEIPVEWIERGANLLIEKATQTTRLGFDEIERTAFLLMVYGIAIAVLRARTDNDEEEEDEEETEHIQEFVDRIDDALSSGASIDDVDGLIRNLARELDVLGDEPADILQDERVLPDEHVVDETTTDTEE